MLITVLGDIAIRGERVRSGSVRRVLARLAAQPGELVSDAALAEALWADDPPSSARTALQTHIGALRDLLEPDRPRRSPGSHVMTSDGGYVLRVDDDELDLLAFEAAAANVERPSVHDLSARRNDASRALSLWAEPVLAECADDPWALATVSRLSERHQGLLNTVVEYELDAGRASQVLALLDDATDRYPYNETLIGQRIIALWRSNRQADALAAYQSARRRLRDDLGVDPGPQLRSLELAVLNHDPALFEHGSRNPDVSSIDPQTTRFVGRVDELERLDHELRAQRLVTLVGPGGVGKSRLARRAASRSAAAFPGGIIVVDLSETDGDGCRRALADRLGIGDHPLADLAASIRHALDGGHRLVLLDTCEHLDAAAADLIDDVLRSPGCSVLATSRAPIGHHDEILVAVEPLRDHEALELLVDRSGVAAGDDDALIEICRRLDGLPLAIELAAGRLRTLPPNELARVVTRSRASLRGGRDRPPRHRGLDETIRWSHDLLSADERWLLRRVSMLRGEFTLGTVVDFAGVDGTDCDIITLFSGLVERSMVGRADGMGRRYRVLDTVRDFVRSSAGAADELAALEDAHAQWVLGRARRAFVGVEQSSMRDLVGEVGPAIDHLRATGSPDELELVVSLGTFWLETSRVSEGRQRLGAALDRWPAAPQVQRIIGTSAHALLAWYQGDGSTNRRLMATAVEGFDESDDGGVGIPGLAQIVRACEAFSRHDLAEAERWAQRAMAALSAPCKPRLVVLYFSANIAWYRSDLPAAIARYEEQRELARALDEPFSHAQATCYEGMARALGGDVERGWALGMAGARLARDHGGDIGSAQAAACLALITHVAGDESACEDHARAAVRAALRQVDTFALRVALPLLAVHAARRGEDQRAAICLGFLQHLLNESAQFLPPPLWEVRDRAIDLTNAALGPTACLRARSQAAALRLDEMIDLVTA